MNAETAIFTVICRHMPQPGQERRNAAVPDCRADTHLLFGTVTVRI